MKFVWYYLNLNLLLNQHLCIFLNFKQLIGAYLFSTDKKTCNSTDGAYNFSNGSDKGIDIKKNDIISIFYDESKLLLTATNLNSGSIASMPI